jgi:hypothetical protein
MRGVWVSGLEASLSNPAPRVAMISLCPRHVLTLLGHRRRGTARNVGGFEQSEPSWPQGITAGGREFRYVVTQPVATRH